MLQCPSRCKRKLLWGTGMEKSLISSLLKTKKKIGIVSLPSIFTWLIYSLNRTALSYNLLSVCSTDPDVSFFPVQVQTFWDTVITAPWKTYLIVEKLCKHTINLGNLCHVHLMLLSSFCIRMSSKNHLREM